MNFFKNVWTDIKIGGAVKMKFGLSESVSRKLKKIKMSS
jgi:hypothetical protein